MRNDEGFATLEDEASHAKRNICFSTRTERCRYVAKISGAASKILMQTLKHLAQATGEYFLMLHGHKD